MFDPPIQFLEPHEYQAQCAKSLAVKIDAISKATLLAAWKDSSSGLIDIRLAFDPFSSGTIYDYSGDIVMYDAIVIGLANGSNYVITKGWIMGDDPETC